MPTFAETATADIEAIYDALQAAHAAHPSSPTLDTLHKALQQALTDFLAEHPEVPTPLDGTPKT
jgi:hypothetical protein